MGTAHGLHGARQQPDEQGGGEPAPAHRTAARRSARRHLQPGQAQGHERKAAGGMTPREATPRTAVGLAPGPVRHMPGASAEGAEIPGATRQAGVLDQVDRQQRQAHQRQDEPALAPRHAQARPQGPDEQQQPGAGHGLTQSIVQHGRQPPGIALRKSLRRADRLHHGHVQTGCVPQQGEGQQAEQPDNRAGAVHRANVSCPG